MLRSYVSDYIDRLCDGSRRDVFKLDLVDGFSGGGLFLEGGVEISGTPLIMLEEAQAAYTRLNGKRVKPLHFDLKFHFVDIAPDHTRYLRRVLSEREFHIPKHEVKIYDGAFEDVVGAIISDIKRRQPRAGRALFLLDQKGFSQVGLDLVRRIFNELAHAEVILTFAAETLLNYMVERPELYAAVRPIELSETDVRNLVDLKQGAGGRAVAQRTLRDHLRLRTGAAYDTPFFIRPRQSRRALWFVHLSRHPVARDVMVQCHWNNFNTFRALWLRWPRHDGLGSSWERIVAPIRVQPVRRWFVAPAIARYHTRRAVLARLLIAVVGRRLPSCRCQSYCGPIL